MKEEIVLDYNYNKPVSIYSFNLLVSDKEVEGLYNSIKIGKNYIQKNKGVTDSTNLSLKKIKNQKVQDNYLLYDEMGDILNIDYYNGDNDKGVVFAPQIIHAIKYIIAKEISSRVLNIEWKDNSIKTENKALNLNNYSLELKRMFLESYCFNGYSININKFVMFYFDNKKLEHKSIKVIIE